MAIHVRYVAPKRDAALIMAAAAPIAAREGAEELLAASQPLVPVDKGDLKASGRVEQDSTAARVVYDATAPDGFAYGIRQHEDLALHHPHGGQAKFLEAPMFTDAPKIAARMLHALARVFRA